MSLVQRIEAALRHSVYISLQFLSQYGSGHFFLLKHNTSGVVFQYRSKKIGKGNNAIGSHYGIIEVTDANGFY